MPVTAKMYVESLIQHGGGVWVPLCQASRLSEDWPPADERHLGSSGNYGHEMDDCPECLSVAAATPGFLHEDGSYKVRSVYLPGKGSEQVRLQAVKSGEIDDPNNAWALATPAGNLEVTIDNPDAWGFFDPGAEYYVEIRRVVPARGNRGG